MRRYKKEQMIFRAGDIRVVRINVNKQLETIIAVKMLVLFLMYFVLAAYPGLWGG